MSRNDIVIVITTIGTYTVSAKYRGGPYIDLFWNDQAKKADAEPFEVINVYDYRAGKPSIEYTLRGVKKAVDEWAQDQGSPRSRQRTMDTYYANAGSR